MKKLLSASIIAIAFALPALADNEPTTPTLIPSSEPGCNQAVLNTTEGSASLEAIYTPNTIGTTWYSDGVQITGNNVPSTCTYDTEMTLPTNPIKAGYEFNGWKILIQCNILSTDVSNNGNAYGYKNDSTGSYGAYSYNTDLFNLTEYNTWGVSWSNGDKVTGVALCSAQSGNSHSYQWGGNSSDWTSDETTLTNATGETQYCWCKATHYTANNAQQCSLSAPAWVFNRGYSSVADCAYFCASNCAGNVGGFSSLRAALFGSNVAQ